MSSLHVYLVFVTKYRRKVFTAAIIDDLRDTFSKVCNDFEAVLIECDSEGDRVHLLLSYPSKVSVSKLANSLNGVSSRLIRNRGYLTVQRAFWDSSLWSPSYFVTTCGGAPPSIVRQYIEAQNTQS